MDQEATTWRATHDGEVIETADTKKEIMWLLTTGHMDDKGHAKRSGEAGTYYYTAPQGQMYVITNITEAN